MFKKLAVILALATAPVLTFAHGPTPAPRHGGQVEEASENWVELVLKTDQMTVFVNDEHDKPVASMRLSAKATVLAGGKKQELSLAAGDGNSLTGKLAMPVSGKAIAVIALTMDGKPAQARFSLTAP
jgi:hypothetical protein